MIFLDAEPARPQHTRRAVTKRTGGRVLRPEHGDQLHFSRLTLVSLGCTERTSDCLMSALGHEVSSLSVSDGRTWYEHQSVNLLQVSWS